MLEQLGWVAGLGSALYFFYSYNISVRKHIKENKEMHDLIKEIHHIVKNN